MLKKFPIYISIIAALMVIFLGLIIGMDSFQIIIRVVIVIALFFIIGSIIQFYFNKNVFIEKENNEEISDAETLGDIQDGNSFKLSKDDDDDE